MALTPPAVAVTTARLLPLGLAGLVLALLGSHVFNGRAIELAIVPVAITVAAVATARFRLVARVAAIALTIVVATLGAVMLDGGSVVDVVRGVWSGPRRLLSTEWPSPLDPAMIAAIGLLTGAATGASMLLAQRPRWRLLPLVPIVAGAIVLIALSAPTPPSARLLVILAAAAVVFALPSSAGDDAGDRGVALDRTVAVSLGSIAVAIVVTTSAVAMADRADPRDPAEPDVRVTLLDPVEATVAIRDADPVIDLMAVTARSSPGQLQLPTRWRLAAFDAYDGQRWVVSLDMHPIGGQLTPAPPDSDSVLVYDVEYLVDAIELVPLPGQAVAVDRDVLTDVDRIAVRLIERPEPGFVIEASAVPPRSPAVAAQVGFPRRQVDELAESFEEHAHRLEGDRSLPPHERLERMAATMRDEWELSSDAVGGGQQHALIERFITDTRRGTREQFVTAFVLLARAAGFDSRVASGFEVPFEELGASFTLRSEHAAVWPEVRLADGSWLPFDPVPQVEAVAEDEPEPQQRQQQAPPAIQPPVDPPDDELTDEEEPEPDSPEAAGGWPLWAVWARRVAAVVAIVVGPLAIAIVIILLLKWRRRRLRARLDDPDARVRGAWANTTDSFIDAGLTIAPTWTDGRIAEQSSAVVSGADDDARRLAALSAAVTFGHRDERESAMMVDDAVSMSAAIDDAIRATRGRWERARWRLSLRSLRKASRSPVVP